MVKTKWLQNYEPHELPEGGTLLQSWDTANKDSEGSNFSVCTTWRYSARHFYLIDVFRDRLEFPDLKRKAKELAKLYRTDVVLIEDKASGTQLIHELRHEGVAVRAAPAQDAGKLTRLNNQTPKFESGFVHLPKRAPWLDAYVLELTTFPNARFDDQVDSTVHALAWDTEQLNSSFENHIEWARVMAEREYGREHESTEIPKGSPLPWQDSRPLPVTGNELTELYNRTYDAALASARSCARCGNALVSGAPRVTDGVDAWHPNCTIMRLSG
jgi:predicted phage terminase large subunit-like protein